MKEKKKKFISIMSILVILQTHSTATFNFTKHSPTVFHTHSTFKKPVYQTLNHFALQPLILTAQQKPASLPSPALPNGAIVHR
jgi:hypothetical protein